MKRRVLAFLLALMLIVGLLPDAALAAEETPKMPTQTDTPTILAAEDGEQLSWSAGKNITCTLDPDTKTLTFSGTGDMSFETHNGAETGLLKQLRLLPPWHSEKNLSNIETVIVGEGITSLASGAINLPMLKFPPNQRDNKTLKTIVLPSTLKTIESNAIGYGNGVKVLELPDGLESIGSEAIVQLKNLETLNIPDSVTSIGDNAFSMCTGLTSVTLPKELQTIPSKLFSSKTKLTSIEIPDTVTEIGDSAFSGSGLTSVTIPEGVVCIGDSAFNSTALTSLKLPSGLKEISNNLVSNCKSLTNVSIPDNVTKIGRNAFLGCDALTSITIPEGITELGEKAFSYCSSLNMITIPASMRIIGDNAFEKWTAEQNISFDMTENEAELLVQKGKNWSGAATVSYIPMDKNWAASISALSAQSGDVVLTGIIDWNNLTCTFTGTAPMSKVTLVLSEQISGGRASFDPKQLTIEYNREQNQYVLTGNGVIKLEPDEGVQGTDVYLSPIFNVTYDEPELKGSGTEEDPYQVGSLADLLLMSEKLSWSQKHQKAYYLQTADLDLAAAGNWSNHMLMNFGGVYNGANHRINNLTFENATAGGGLFGPLQTGATVKNVIIDASCSFTGSSKIGSIAGEIEKRAENIRIINCENHADVISTAKTSDTVVSAYAGGIFGNAGDEVHFIDCRNYGDISSNQQATGFSIIGAHRTGGIAGSGGEYINCHNYGNITASYMSGGIVGSTNGDIIACSNHGAISAAGDGTGVSAKNGGVGGIAGYAGSVEGCYNTGYITSNLGSTGGIAGYANLNSVLVSNCWNTGAVSSTYDNGCCGTIVGNSVIFTADEFKGENLFSLDYDGAPPLIGSAEDEMLAVLPTVKTVSDEELKSEAFLRQLQTYNSVFLTFANWVKGSDGYPEIDGVKTKPNYAKDILSAQAAGIKLPLYEESRTIRMAMPSGTDLTNLILTLELSDKATVSPSSGQAVDFSKGPVIYTVMAEDGSKKEYTVDLTYAGDSGLAALEIGSSTLHQNSVLNGADFSPDKTEYYCGVFNSMDILSSGSDNMVIRAVPAVADSTVTVSINGGPQTDVKTVSSTADSAWYLLGVADHRLNAAKPETLLKPGENTLTFTVTTPNATVSIYTVRFTLRLTAYLSALEGIEKMYPAQDYPKLDIDEFTLDVPENVTELTMDYSISFVPGEGKIAVTNPENSNMTAYSGIAGLTFGPCKYVGSVLLTPNQQEFTIKLSSTDDDHSGDRIYTFHINWLKSYTLRFNITNAGGSVRLFDANGNLLNDVNGSYNLVTGNTYRYIAVAPGCVATEGCISGSVPGDVVPITLKSAAAADNLPDFSGDWINFRGNDQNMGIINAPTPKTAEDARLKWAIQSGTGWTGSPMPPIILEGKLYTAVGRNVIVLDRETGDTLQISDPLPGGLGFSLNPMTYGGGMLFVPLTNGQVVALNAETLEQLWVTEKFANYQSLSPITYHDGYIYTGVWKSVTDGRYLAFEVTDENPQSSNETKYATWIVDEGRGFYWAGAYATDQYVIFGSDDASGAILYSVHPKTGEILDRLTNIQGDIRSTISATDDGYVYFSTKAGLFAKVKVDSSGKFSDFESVNLGNGFSAMCTGTPLVYNGVAFIGVGDGANQFSDGKHCYAIVDVATMTVLDSVPTPGYAQTSALLSTAYAESGKLYVYVTCNQKPGGIFVITYDTATKKAFGSELFSPTGDMAQYCICSIVADRDGTLYFKNDSGYFMAVGGAPLFCVTYHLNGGTSDILSDGINVAYWTSALGSKLVTPIRSGYSFVGWYADEACRGDSYKTVTEALKDVTDLYAKWMKINLPPTPSVTYYTLTAVAGEGGSISPGGRVSVLQNLSQTFTVTPDDGYVIADVLVDGASVGAVTEYTFEMVTTFHTIEVRFRKVRERPDWNPFVDVDSSHWFHDSVKYAYEQDLMVGTDSARFSPTLNTSRAMIATILWRQAGCPAASGANTFDDVAPGMWYTDAVIWAAENGIVKGFGNGKFAPNNPITREQFAAMLWRYAHRPVASAALDKFSDSNKVSEWAADALRWAVAQNIVIGKGDILDPTGTATRAEIATIIYRFFTGGNV